MVIIEGESLRIEQGNQSKMTAATCSEATADIVKERCWDQREAQPGEPRCVICGRYGEYICDVTDEDICSLDCKNTLLQRVANSQPRVGRLPSMRLPATDECCYVQATEDKSASQSLTENQIELLRNRLEICVKSQSFVPAPILSFSSCNLLEKLLQNIEAVGFAIPTPIQMQAIPAAMTGKSLLVSAETGSGKTASFLIPIISRCARVRLDCPSSEQKRPLAIVLTPTRELCVQVEEHAKLLGKGLPFKTALVVGGDAVPGQIHRIKQGVELIVATPGRIIDLLSNYDVELEEVATLVLDEVDCMLQRGFRDQVIQLVQALSQPQVLMFSATLQEDIQRMANSMVKGDILIISIGKPNRPNGAVKQVAIWVESKFKKQKLFDILTTKHHFTPPAVVFVGSRFGADLLSEAITATTGIKALSIHGEKPMKERREVMSSFLLGEIPVLVATAVLGRGIDLVGVRQVIVFDMPNSIGEYVHQIGRASRLREAGTAFVFVNEENRKIFRELVEILKSSGAAVPRELAKSWYTTCSSSVSRRDSSHKKRKHGC